ncbi:MAG: glycosyltransferase family 4 protein [bacterium]|nr:glycosyltransferase family 4 protein [bacterium]
MKILHVIDKSFLGGGQAAVRNLLDGFRGSDVDTHLACRDGGPLIDAARALQTEVHPVAFDKRFRPGPARAVAAIAGRHAIDVVHAHGLVAAFYCTLARSFFALRAPLIYHQHGFHHHNYGGLTIGLRKAVERGVCRRADRVVPVSAADAARLEAGGYAPRERIELIHYGIPEPAASAEEIGEARRLAGFEAERPLVGLVGRLHPQKGVDVFLRAAARVAEEEPRTGFVVVGSGEIEAELHALARTLGLGDSLCWAGGRPSAAFLPLMDVAVLSSRWEGLPFVLLEYMAGGRAIVTTDVAGCLEAVGPDEAEIVPREDDAAMADAILRLLRAPTLAQERAQAAATRFAQQFTLAAMVRRWTALYEELVR